MLTGKVLHVRLKKISQFINRLEYSNIFLNLFLDIAMVPTKTCKTFGNQALHAPIEPWPLIWKKKNKKKAIFNIFF